MLYSLDTQNFSFVNCPIDHQRINKGLATNSVCVFITSEIQLIIVAFALQTYFWSFDIKRFYRDAAEDLLWEILRLYMFL